MAAKNPAVAELAEKMNQVLRDRRGQGEDGYPLTLKRLADLADPAATDDLRAKAVKHKTFTGQVVRARKKDADTPVALAEDVDRLADSRLLLEWALEQTCTPKAPAQPVDKLTKKVDEPLRKPLTDAIERRVRANALPATVDAVELRNKTYLFLKRMPPPKPPAQELAERLIAALRSQRDSGPYPVPLQQLLDAIGADKKLVKKALTHEVFRRQVIVAAPKDPEAPAVLAEDRGRLVASRKLLEYTLASVCTPKKRMAGIGTLKDEVAPELQQDFEAALRRQVDESTLPDSVGVVTIDGEFALYRTALAPEASFVLAAKLLDDLRGRRERGRLYPVPLSEMVREVQPGAAQTLIDRAVADKTFKKQAVVAMAKQAGAPAVLKGDEHILAASPLLLEFVLSITHSESNQAIPVTDLKKKVSKDLQRPFESAVQDALTGFALPAGVGALRIKKKDHLFLMRDVNAAGPLPREDLPVAATPTTLAPPSEERAGDGRPALDFGTAFDEAFTRLDQQRGSPNFVSLVDLRRELPVDRDTFDRELRDLRRAGLFSLNAAEGREGLTHEEQAAAIREEGTLLLFVARKPRGSEDSTPGFIPKHTNPS
ncbi:MAG: hypothetical protein HYS12_25520 [Planctomycetes bacterium]|nr:hypothetical protein [Planctomycetota bacterium]